MSERIWAEIDGDMVTNTFVGDEQFAAFVADQHDLVLEVTDLSPRPSKNWHYDGGDWKPPQPYPSWAWDGTQWQPPVPRPDEGDWTWDEDGQEWVEVEDDVD